MENHPYVDTQSAILMHNLYVIEIEKGKKERSDIKEKIRKEEGKKIEKA